MNRSTTSPERAFGIIPSMDFSSHCSSARTEVFANKLKLELVSGRERHEAIMEKREEPEGPDFEAAVKAIRAAADALSKKEVQD